MSTNEILWLSLGFAAQGMFTARFLVQWLASERKGESYIPIAFWWLSLTGGLMLLTYTIYRQDPVLITGQAFGVVVYARNLILISRRGSDNKTQDEPTSGPTEAKTLPLSQEPVVVNQAA